MYIPLVICIVAIIFHALLTERKRTIKRHVSYCSAWWSSNRVISSMDTISLNKKYTRYINFKVLCCIMKNFLLHSFVKLFWTMTYSHSINKIMVIEKTKQKSYVLIKLEFCQTHFLRLCYVFILLFQWRCNGNVWRKR